MNILFIPIFRVRSIAFELYSLSFSFEQAFILFFCFKSYARLHNQFFSRASASFKKRGRRNRFFFSVLQPGQLLVVYLGALTNPTELRNPRTVVSEQHKIWQSTDFKALKLWNIWSENVFTCTQQVFLPCICTWSVRNKLLGLGVIVRKKSSRLD